MEQIIDTRNLYLDLDVEHLNFIFFLVAYSCGCLENRRI